MFNKNNTIKLRIVDVNNDGLGIAKVFDNETNKNVVFFVKDALVGDTVDAVITKVNKTIIFAKALKIIEKSQYRVVPKCKVSNECGGCQLLSLDYKKQLEIKKTMVKNNLLNIAKLDETVIDNAGFDIVGMKSPYRFRNKIIIPFGTKNGNIISGYYAGRTHYIIDNTSCATAFAHHEIIIDIMKRLLKENNISIYDENTKKGIFRQLMLRKANETDELSITFIVNDSEPNKNIDKYNTIVKSLIYEFDSQCKNSSLNTKIDSISLNINTSANNVLLGKKSLLLYGNDFIKDKMTLKVNNKEYSLYFNISDLSFYQTNIYMTKVLYETVFEYAGIKKDDKVLDMYCGIGTMTLFASLFAKEVVGTKIIEKAIFNANNNAKLNNISNANFICKDLDNDLNSDNTIVDAFIRPKVGAVSDRSYRELQYNKINDNNDLLNYSYDVMIVDPPRKGLSANVKKYIIEHKPKKLVYVSCDSATLSRDLKDILDNTDYKVKKIKVVDMFAHTMHVETVVLLL